MKKYVFQPEHRFLFVTFVVVAIGKTPHYCGDNFSKALDLYDRYKSEHRAPQIWDCSRGRNGVRINNNIRIL